MSGDVMLSQSVATDARWYRRLTGHTGAIVSARDWTLVKDAGAS